MKIMNCKKAKQISLVSILEKIGAVKKKITEREIWYLNPFSNEKTASFKIDIAKNIWFDFGNLGRGGNVLDFVMLYYQCDLKGALAILDKDFHSFSFHKQPILKFTGQIKKNYEIESIKPITSYRLISYLKSRSLNIEMVKRYCVEVNYLMYGKRRYGLGFFNNEGGYEIRSEYFKGCLGKKAITTILNDSNTVSIFESWSDFLSYLTFKKEIPEEDFIILNSTALIKNTLELLHTYSAVKVFFDNDNSGVAALKLVQENFKNKVINCSVQYSDFNDLNDYLINQKK